MVTGAAASCRNGRRAWITCGPGASGQRAEYGYAATSNGLPSTYHTTWGVGGSTTASRRSVDSAAGASGSRSSRRPFAGEATRTLAVRGARDGPGGETRPADLAHEA